MTTRASARADVRRARRLRRSSIAIGVVASLTAGLLAAGGFATSAAAAVGEVRGTVFRDMNQDGVFNATAGGDGLVDAVIPGVTVTAFDASGAVVGAPVQSGSDGTYRVDAGGLADGTPLRLIFSGFPEGYVDSAAGTDNGTSVQFSTVGAEGVDFALHTGDDFSRGNQTPLLTVIQANGLSTGASSDARAVSVILPQQAIHTATPAAASTLATFGEVGAVWGSTVRSLGGGTFEAYLSSVLKRHSGFGPQGIAGLYRVEFTVAADGTVTRTGLTALDLAAGANAPGWGTVTRDLVDRVNGATVDQGAFDNIGKVGIGGIVLDGTTLYVVNLAERAVFAYDTTNFAAGPTRIELPVGANERPWAVAVRNGRLYVGLTDTSIANGARVVSAPVGSTSAASFAVDVAVPLSYSRGIAWHADRPNDPRTTGQTVAQWHPWNDDETALFTSADFTSEQTTNGGFPISNFGLRFRAWAQPILSGLAFDENDNLVIGLADRFSFQGGVGNLWADFDSDNSHDNVTAIPIGDTLFAGFDPVSRTYGLESDGSVVTTGAGNVLVTRVRSLGTPVAAGQTAREGIQGPGGREFFEDSVGWNGAGNFVPGEGVVHDETTLGSVSVLPGSGQVTTPAYDAAQSYSVGGNRFMSLGDGHSIDGFDQYTSSDSRYFAKSGGLGSVAYAVADAPIEIGNRVWIDSDRDGQQDAGEPALNGVTVRLLSADGATQIATTTTGGAGDYVFSSDNASGYVLAPNTAYIVEFVLPSGSIAADVVGPNAARYAGLTGAQLAFTGPNAAGAGDLVDSDAVPAIGGATARATVTTGAYGNNDHSIDAGFAQRTYAVGDRVWLDENPAVAGIQATDKNGVQDAGEPGLPGVTVRLFTAGGTLVATTTTGASGLYLFDEVPAGDYYVEFGTPPGGSYYTTTANTGDDTADSDIPADSATGGRTATFTLDQNAVAPGYTAQPFTATQGVDPTKDAGFVTYTPQISVVKRDAAGNDANTSASAVDVGPAGGAASLEFVLTNTGDEPLTDIAVTDAQGTGSSGQVQNISCTSPAGATIPLPWNGRLLPGETVTCTASLTGVAAGANHLDTVTVTADGAITGRPVTDDDPYNAVYRTYAVGDRVWVDANANGVQDASEASLAGVVVTLLDAAGTAVPGVSPVTTDANGAYAFDDLAAGRYIVQFTAPAGYRFTQTGQGAAGSDSDASPTTGRTGVIDLGPGNAALEQRAGIRATAGIDPTWDAGVIPLQVSVGDLVWVDTNGNGVQDAGEPGLPGVTLVLTGPDGQPVTDVFGKTVAPVQTDGAGGYGFGALPPLAAGQSYTVSIDTAASATVLRPYKPSPTGQGTTATDSSNGSATSGPLQQDGARDSTLDFGFVPFAPAITIVKTDAAGNDANTTASAVDLTSSAGSTGLSFRITNTGDEPLVNLTVSDAITLGGGQVTGLSCTFPGGSTGLTWAGPLAPSASFPCTATLAGVRGGTSHTDVATVTATGQNTGTPVTDDDPYNALVLPQVSVGDRVWVDTNANGIQDDGEPGLGGVWLTLVGPNGAAVTSVLGQPVAPVQTAPDGSYSFTGLPVTAAGQGYTVRVDTVRSAGVLAPYIPTLEGQGGDRGKDSSTGSATSGALTQDGQSDVTLDFGWRPRTYAVGDRVWLDENRDGVQNDGEPSLAGVTVVLLDDAGEPVGSTVTDANGLYLFDDLLPGDYRLRFEPTAEQRTLYEFTTTAQGTRPDLDSDASASGETREFPVGPGTVDPAYRAQSFAATEGVDPTWDAGLVAITYAVGDRVWYDANDNGVQDAGERSAAGIGVVLLDGTGAELARTTTDASGRYVFDGLLPGDYAVRFELPADVAAKYRFTAQRSGTDATVDSDADAKGRTATFHLGHDTVGLVATVDGLTFVARGGIDPTWDAGLSLIPPVLPPAPLLLAVTGAAVPWLLVGAGLLVVVIGGAVLLIARRRRNTAR